MQSVAIGYYGRLKISPKETLEVVKMIRDIVGCQPDLHGREKNRMKAGALYRLVPRVSSSRCFTP